MRKSIVVCGIDVSSKKLDLCLEVGGERSSCSFDNTSTGHQMLIAHLTRKGRSAQVVVEATGVYSLELCLALHKARRVEVMVVNPRSASDFARALLKRSKTDATDAVTLLEYVKRMPFVAWLPPSDQVVRLQRITRHLQGQTAMRTQELNRLHALRRVGGSHGIQDELEHHIAFLDDSSERLRKQALEIVEADPKLQEMLAQLTSIKGIATVSGLTLLAELATLPEDMTARQWVAHAGLDPRHVESGTSLRKPARISRVGNAHLRAALYMPALVALRHEPSVRAFYEKLLGRGKKPMVGVVAVMRKLLHALHGMLRSRTHFDGTKFHPAGA